MDGGGLDERVRGVFAAVPAVAVALAGEDFAEALVFHAALVAGVAGFQGGEFGFDVAGRVRHGVRLHGEVGRNGKCGES